MIHLTFYKQHPAATKFCNMVMCLLKLEIYVVDPGWVAFKYQVVKMEHIGTSAQLFVVG